LPSLALAPRKSTSNHRAGYWGQTRVLLQQLLTGWVVNIKRTVRLLTEPQEPLAGTLRAEVAASG
jgi:hypothetical protein